MGKFRLLTILTVIGMAFAAPGKTVKASSFGFNPEDATEALQKAIDSGAEKVIVDNTGRDWIIRPVHVFRSNVEIVFEKGVTLRAKKGEFKGRTDSLFKIDRPADADRSSNIKLRGEGGVTLVMNKKDYADPKLYRYAQWRHVIAVFNSENVSVENLHLKSSGGDGIYILNCRNVKVENVVSEDHYRQGMSVISVDGLTVRNSKFIKTSGTAPQCGIDFEPNRQGHGFSNVLIENCEFSENTRAGIMFCLDLQQKPVSFVVKNCVFKGNGTGFCVNSMKSRGELRMENCRAEGNLHAGCEIKVQSENGLKLVLKNMMLDARSSADAAPIELVGGESDMGGIVFDNVKLVSSRPGCLAFTPVTGYGLTSVSGSVFCGNEPGKLRPFDLKKFVAARKPDPSARISDAPRIVNVKKLVPVSGKTVPAGLKYKLRNRFSFVQAVPSAGVWPIRFKGEQIGKRPYELRCVVYDANGTMWDQFSTTETDFTYKLNVGNEKGGAFRFSVSMPGGHIVSLTPTGSAQAIHTPDFVGLFGGYGLRFHFVVPADAEYVGVMAKASKAEPADVQLLDASGKVVKELKKITGTVYLKAPRRKTEKDEIWSIRFPWAKEDYAFRICPPSLPLAAPAPQNLLTEK